MANVILRVKREDGSWAEIPALTGPEGPQGVSIDDIVLKSQEGGVSTYLILLSDGSKKTFQVTDGATITDISLINTNALIDTYRISISNGSYFEFRVTNGRGIKNIAKTNTDVLTDTYTISYNDNTTSTYTITNGRGIDYIEKDQTVGISDRYAIHYNDGTTSYYHVVNGEKGDTGYGMPTGGTTGQILSKKSDNNYDVEWIDNNPSSHNPSSLEVMYDKDNKAIKFVDSTNIVTFAINPDPSDATVVITSGTCKQVGNSISVPKNSLVEYTVSKDGMITKSGYLNVVEDTSMDIKLSLPPVSLTINNTVLHSDTTLTYDDGSGNSQTATVNGNESVTINVVPNTIIKATASGLGKGTYFILTNTSGSIDYTPWAAGGAGGGAWAYCCNSIKTVNSTDSISLTYNDTLTGGSNTITGTGSASNTSGDYGISTPISITTTSNTNTYIFNYNPSPTETYSFGGMFALIDTNGVGSVIGSSSNQGGGGGDHDYGDLL